MSSHHRNDSFPYLLARRRNQDQAHQPMPNFLRRMWDNAVRWTFGTSRIREHQEESENRDSTSPTSTSDPKIRKTDAHVFAWTAPSGTGTRPILAPLSDTSPQAEVSGTTAPTTTHTLASSTVPSPLSSTPSSPLLNTTITLPSATLAPSSINADEQRNAHGPTTFTMADIGLPTYPNPDPLAEELLEPVKSALEKLKRTSVPPYNSKLKSKPHLQVVKERLLPIGEFIVEQTKGNGALEMRLCHHIAAHYWPLLPQPPLKAHLQIHEMYHNALWLRAQRDQRDQRPAPASPPGGDTPPPPL